jgi:hypothetical protein
MCSIIVVNQSTLWPSLPLGYFALPFGRCYEHSHACLTSSIWANQPISLHSFLVGCLNPCFQGTNVWVVSPQPTNSKLRDVWMGIEDEGHCPSGCFFYLCKVVSHSSRAPREEIGMGCGGPDDPREKVGLPIGPLTVGHDLQGPESKPFCPPIQPKYMWGEPHCKAFVWLPMPSLNKCN